jgi:hypothetical protein
MKKEKTKKQENSTQMLARVRKKQAEEMKGMPTGERMQYINAKAEHCKQRAARLHKEPPRTEQVLIRLTDTERVIIEKAAAEENMTVSAWVRECALGKKSPMDKIAERLERIESFLHVYHSLK